MNNNYSAVFIDDGIGFKAVERYQKRRAVLADKINHLIVICGFEQPTDTRTTWSHTGSFINQDPLMLYLTGINQLKTALILDPYSKESPEILFLAKKNERNEFWDGCQIGVGSQDHIEVARTITGFTDIRDIKTLNQVIIEKLKEKPYKAGLYWHQSKVTGKIFHDHNYKFKKRIERLLRANNLTTVEITNIASLLWSQRLALDPIDLENVKTAMQKTQSAFINLLKKLKYFKTETEVAGFLDGQLAVNSYFRNSFPSITAGGSNATVLHYRKNNSTLPSNRLLLIDYGIRWYSTNTDISRTVPVNGSFNPLQKLLYTIVLNAQKLVESRVRAGISILELDKMCWDFINNEILKYFPDNDKSSTARYNRKPHTVSHLIGHQVHDCDPFGDYKNEQLKSGWIISNEPGIYGHFIINLNGKVYNEKTGIRIEDNLLVTEEGCINLSNDIPKEIKDIESLIK
ncbi:MAG: M24 family metallopeptidase [bacterium]|nr:M24 family metallopeptidase [bacterium]